MTKLSKKDEERNEKLLNHLNIDIEDVLDVFRKHKVHGHFIITSFYDEELKKDMTAVGFGGDIIKTLNSVQTGIKDVCDIILKENKLNSDPRFH